MKRILFTILLITSLWGTLIAQPKEGRIYSEHYLSRYALFEKESPINSNDIVFLGNSLTQGGKWEEYFSKTQTKLAKSGGAIRNRGIIGDDAPGIYDRLNQILPGKPKKIFLLVGINDVSHNLSADTILANIKKVATRIINDSPDTKLYIQSLLPFNKEKCKYKSMVGKTERIKEVNIGIKKMAKELQIKHIELYKYFTEAGTPELKAEFTTDGLHINQEGYKIWVDRVKKYVK